MTLPLLKELLKELPFYDTFLIPPRIISDKLIIQKINDDSFLYNDNSSYFMNKRHTKSEKIKGSPFELAEFDDFF